MAEHRGLAANGDAHALGKSMGTVRVQLTTIFHKAGVRSRTALTAKALREGWVQ